jgi:hypothetical protein
MNRRGVIRLALASLLCAATLAACTGTSETGPPFLMAVAVGGGTGGTATAHLLLLQDTFGTTAGATRDVLAVPGSDRTLDYPAVSMDVADRLGDRSELVVLTRQLGAGAPISRVRTYAFGQIDVNDPSSFQESRAVLSLSGETGSVFDSQTAPCFTAVQTDRSGDMLALLDDPSRCGVAALPRIFVVDRSQSPPEVTDLTGGRSVVPAAPFLDQHGVGRVLFLVSAINASQVWAADLDTLTPVQHKQLELDGTTQRSLESTGSSLWGLLADTTLVSTPYPDGGSRAQVDTVADADLAVGDPVGATSQILVTGPSGTVVLDDAADDAPAVVQGGATVAGVAALLNPFDGFGYVYAAGRVYVIDLYAARGQDGVPTAGFDVPELAYPQDIDGSAVSATASTRGFTPAAP